MSAAIGSVLLEPRRVAPAAPPTNITLAEDFIGLAVRLLWDRAHGGRSIGVITTAAGTVLQRMLDHTKAGHAAAIEKLRAWVQPMVDSVQGLASGLGEEPLKTGEQMVAFLAGIAGGLTTDQIRVRIDGVLQILQGDLGITSTFIDEQVTAIFDEAIAQLRAAPADPDADAQENRLEIIALLRRVRRQVHGQFTLPPLNTDRLAGPLLDELRLRNFDSYTKRTAAIGSSIKSTLTLTSTIADEIPFSLGFGGGGPGAATRATGEGRAWYASWLAGEDINNTDTSKSPVLAEYTFKHVSADTMEGLALHSAWITPLIEGILLLVLNLKEGNYLVPALSAMRDTLSIFLVPVDIEIGAGYILLMSAVFALLGTLEGRGYDSHDGFLFLYRLVFRFGATSLPISILREFLLSFLTLLNGDTHADKPADPQNRNQADGFIQLFLRIVGPLIHVAAIPHTYFSLNLNVDNAAGKAKHPWGTFLAAIVFGGLGIAALIYIFVILLCNALAGDFPDAGVAAGSFFKGYGLGLLQFLGFFYLINDGSTRGGKRGYKPDQSRGTEIAFDGYPDPANSPYHLPYEKGVSAECVQGNSGLWSHNSVLDPAQVFAYDFSLKLGADVLSMRDGQVHEVVDSTDDGDHDHDGNHIVIKHITAAKPNADPTYDKGVSGTAAAPTYAVYYHGQKGSIARAFGGTLPAVGTEVPQGKVIMSCDSTGMSRFNHIHVDVRPDNGSNQPDNFTIPFVFKEVSGSGVPGSQNYYHSDNTKVP